MLWGMNPPRGPEINDRVITVSLKELIPKSLSHRGIFSHWDVWKYVPSVETQYAARRTHPYITRRRSYQLPYMNRIDSPRHLPLHLSSPRHTLKEGQGKVALARWEIILLTIQFENPLPLSASSW